MKKLTRKGSGFTLIELLVVIAIIAILAAILFPVFAKARGMARKATCQNNLKQVALAYQMYYNDYDATLPSSALSGATAWAAASSLDFRTRRGRIPTPSSDPAFKPMTWAECLYTYKRNAHLIYCPEDPNAPSAQDIATNPAAVANLKVTYILKLAIDAGWFGQGAGSMCKKEGDFAYPADQVLFFERMGWHWGDQSKGDVYATSGQNYADDRRKDASVNAAFMDGHVRPVRIGGPPGQTALYGEPDYYNVFGETGTVMNILGGIFASMFIIGGTDLI